jgi:hypothetical protein
MKIRRKIRYKYTGIKRLSLIAGVSLLALVFNLLMIRLSTGTDFPLFLDTIGAAAVTVLFGFRAGAAVAVLTHISVDLFLSLPVSFIPFLPVHLVSILIMYLLQRKGRFTSLVDAVTAVGLVAFANAFAGSLVSLVFFSGITGHPSDYLVSGFISSGLSLFWAGFWGRVPINMVDKCITVFIVFGLKVMVERRTGSEEADFTA